MGAEGPVTLNVDPKIVREIVEKQVVAAVTASFEGQLNIVETLVRQVLAQRVDSKGDVERYNSSDSKTYLEWLCNSAIKASVKKAVEAWASSKQQHIQAAVERRLKAENSNISKALVDALVQGATKGQYNLKVTVNGVNGRDE